MFGLFVITGLAHAPRLVSGIFLALCPLCALVGFVVAGVAATNGKREMRQLRDHPSRRLRPPNPRYAAG